MEHWTIQNGAAQLSCCREAGVCDAQPCGRSCPAARSHYRGDGEQIEGSRRVVATRGLQVAEWVPTTNTGSSELLLVDGAGRQVSPLHDIPTFARAKAMEQRFPALWGSARRPMVVHGTVVGPRK